jgi:hypothetical protein
LFSDTGREDFLAQITRKRGTSFKELLDQFRVSLPTIRIYPANLKEKGFLNAHTAVQF